MWLFSSNAEYAAEAYECKSAQGLQQPKIGPDLEDTIWI